MISTAIDDAGRRIAARTLPVLTPLRVGLGFLLVAILALPFADLTISGHDPWPVARAILTGFVTPDFSAIEGLGWSAAVTLAFAFCGLAAGCSAGFVMALFYRFGPVRWVAAFLRSIHELIWALLLMAVTGPTAATGVIAIGLAYSGIFAKVYAEILDEADPRPAEFLPPGVGAISRFFYARLAVALPAVRSYTLYRLECAMRSSAVLGFIGLPTLGFQLDTFFKQGSYSAAAAVLIIYFALIATIRIWVQRPLVPVYLIASVAVLMAYGGPPIAGSSLINFITQDIVPVPLRNGDFLTAATWERLWSWVAALTADQAVPGAWATLIVGQITLALTGLIALASFPLIVPRLAGKIGAVFGHIGLVVGRSTPEYMLAYLLLQIFGPSMLPALIALAIHNGAIIGHLMGRHAAETVRTLRINAPGGANLYLYELLPRLYGQFLALCLYRWEIILRESAILGSLGIATLGFYIDSATAEIRLDRAMFLICVTAAITLAVDALSRSLRRRLKLKSVAAMC